MPTASLQVCHLFLQHLNTCINGINGWLNFPHKKGAGNLSQVIKNKVYSKSDTNKLLNRGPPLKNSLRGNSIHKIMLNIVQHTPKHLEKVLSNGATQAEPLHEITMTAVDSHSKE